MINIATATTINSRTSLISASSFWADQTSSPWAPSRDSLRIAAHASRAGRRPWGSCPSCCRHPLTVGGSDRLHDGDLAVGSFLGHRTRLHPFGVGALAHLDFALHALELVDIRPLYRGSVSHRAATPRFAFAPRCRPYIVQ